MSTTPEVVVGQIWEPKFGSQVLKDTVRIVCRYPFENDDRGGALWVVERLNHMKGLERLPESTLRQWWDITAASTVGSLPSLEAEER